jgi:hypothetical protein
VDINGALVEVKEQQKAIGRMEELQKEGRSLRSIAAVLALEGYALSHAGVKKILVATRGTR